ncbi:MAG: hypothetical protein Q9M40_05600 [Sulfurimonas sp.]|nr:hypothetical protein [Sulfurimonas sp.]
MVDKFQNDKDIKLFLMTLKVEGGVGLNLIEADYVYNIFDPCMGTSRGLKNQAVDRIIEWDKKTRYFPIK